MIEFKNWTLHSDRKVLARQYDNLSRTLLVGGELPDGYSWAMLVKAGEAMDVIALSPMEGGVGVVLTADQLSLSGDYRMQLRGTRGEEVRHTDVITVFIPASLSGDAQWPTVPSEFSQLEQKLEELNRHPPVPGAGGYWRIWDAEKGVYAESEFPLPNSSGASFTRIGDNLTVSEDGVLSVRTTNEAEADNTLPITSAGVHTQLGNVEILLAAL